MTDVLANLAPHFFQVAYVVHDLPTAEQWFQRVWGVPKFVRMEKVTFGEGCRYRGRPANAVVDLSLGFAKETQVELIQSLQGPSIYTEFLDAKGPGLHHVAFAVPDFPAAVAHMRAAGLESILDGTMSTGMRVDFAYFDCDAQGASVIELLGFDDAAWAFMQQLKAGTI